MFDTLEKRKSLSKWIFSIFTCCILICFGMRYISDIFNAIAWLIGLAKPLVIGAILALILNVPMSFFERNLRSKTKLRKGVRSPSIVLALVLVVGIFVGVIYPGNVDCKFSYNNEKLSVELPQEKCARLFEIDFKK